VLPLNLPRVDRQQPNSPVTNQGPWILTMSLPNLPLWLDRTAMIRQSEGTVCEVRSVHDVTYNSVIHYILHRSLALLPGPKRALADGPEHPPGMPVLLPRLDAGGADKCTVCCLYDIP
jgi:hypothetical protein